MVDHPWCWTDRRQPAVIDKGQGGVGWKLLPAWFGCVQILEEGERGDERLGGHRTRKGDGLEHIGEIKARRWAIARGKEEQMVAVSDWMLALERLHHGNVGDRLWNRGERFPPRTRASGTGITPAGQPDEKEPDGHASAGSARVAVHRARVPHGERCARSRHRASQEYHP